ncbi:DUF4159 domain-containing protein [Arhodomonas sp. AD133]|uniref:DUF4159 domain-containing protein n=1 Tax=Arhodomonas sp. AD133 TaxID=3415009 RepID=UPI003EC0BF8F
MTPRNDPPDGMVRQRHWHRNVLATGLTAILAGSLTAPAAARPPMADGEPASHEFHFTRGIYGAGSGNGWGPRWAVDYPKADQQFLVALKRLTLVDAPDAEHAIELRAEALQAYPFVYVLEVGSMSLTDSEVAALRNYLLAGGFLVIDDFWGDWAWQHFEEQMRRVFPARRIEEVPMDHPVFHVFYDIDEVVQVPNVQLASGQGPTHEQGGRVPRVRGIFDDDGRLMVLINWNTDLGDGWEWADSPSYHLRYSTYAFKIGVNFVIYAMTH